MPSLDDLRKRIASVKSTQKITKAMKMVAAAKLRKAQEMAEKGRPYSDKMDVIIQNLSKAINDPSNAPKLLVGTGEDKIHLCVVMTADRGLCGGFNTNICKLAKKYFDEAIKSSKNLKIITVGTKGLDQLKRDYGKYIIKKINLKDKKKLTFLDAEEIGKQIVELFKNKEFASEMNRVDANAINDMLMPWLENAATQRTAIRTGSILDNTIADFISKKTDLLPVSYTHLTLPTSDLV